MNSGLSLPMLFTACAGDPSADTYANDTALPETEPCAAKDDGSGDAWIPAAHPGGAAWVLSENHDVCVLLADAEDENFTGYSRGLHLIRGGQPLGAYSARSWLDAPGWLPLVSTTPRTDGAPALIDKKDTLNLALEGSDEHGCPAHALMASVTAEDADGVFLASLAVSGIPYLLLPKSGWIFVTDDSAGSFIFPAGMVAGDSSDFSSFRSLIAVQNGVADVFLFAASEIPWFQVEAGDDFMELDIDHGCEQGVTSADLLMVVHVLGE